MKFNHNKIILSDKPIGAGPNSRIAFPGLVMRCVIVHGPAIFFLAKVGAWQWGIPVLIFAEIVFTYCLRQKIVTEKSPYAVFIALSMTFHPFLFFLSSLMFLLAYFGRLSWLHLLFIFAFSFSTFIVHRQLEKISMKRVLTHVRQKKVFQESYVDESPVVVFSPFNIKDPDGYGYKPTILDDILSKWVWFPTFIIIPIAQMATFTTPHRDLDLAAFMMAFVFLIMAIGGNVMTFHLLLNWKLLRMSERGEIPVTESAAPKETPKKKLTPRKKKDADAGFWSFWGGGDSHGDGGGDGGGD